MIVVGLAALLAPACYVMYGKFISGEKMEAANALAISVLGGPSLRTVTLAFHAFSEGKRSPYRRTQAFMEKVRDWAAKRIGGAGFTPDPSKW